MPAVASVSSAASTVTVCASFQLVEMNVNDDSCTDMSSSPLFVMLTVTASVGCDVKTTVYSPLPPSSTVNVVGVTVTPRVSSSVIVIVVPSTVRPLALVVPLTDTVSSSSSILSSTGLSVNVAVPLD